MQRDELLAALVAARARLDSALAGLGVDELTGPGPAGDWSIKDLLSHVTACDVDVLTNLGKVKRGQKPGRTAWDKAAVQAQNEAWHIEFKDRALERVLADYDGVHQQMLRQVRGLTDAALQAPASWLQGRPLFRYFLDDVEAHENEHAEEIALWKRSRQSPGV